LDFWFENKPSGNLAPGEIWSRSLVNENVVSS
jgi:hypothetical protein